MIGMLALLRRDPAVPAAARSAVLARHAPTVVAALLRSFPFATRGGPRAFETARTLNALAVQLLSAFAHCGVAGEVGALDWIAAAGQGAASALDDFNDSEAAVTGLLAALEGLLPRLGAGEREAVWAALRRLHRRLDVRARTRFALVRWLTAAVLGRATVAADASLTASSFPAAKASASQILTGTPFWY